MINLIKVLRRLRQYVRALLRRDLLIQVEAQLPVQVLGSDYGAWGVVAGNLDCDSTVLSFGVGTDPSFDMALIEQKRLIVHAFDFTPKSIKWVEDNIADERFIFHRYGLSAEDGEVKIFLPANGEYVSASICCHDGASDRSINVPVFSLATICEKLRIPRIDYMKMDVEGCEYQVIESR